MRWGCKQETSWQYRPIQLDSQALRIFLQLFHHSLNERDSVGYRVSELSKSVTLIELLKRVSKLLRSSANPVFLRSSISLALLPHEIVFYLTPCSTTIQWKKYSYLTSVEMNNKVFLWVLLHRSVQLDWYGTSHIFKVGGYCDSHSLLQQSASDWFPGTRRTLWKSAWGA